MTVYDYLTSSQKRLPCKIYDNKTQKEIRYDPNLTPLENLNADKKLKIISYKKQFIQDTFYRVFDNKQTTQKRLYIIFYVEQQKGSN